MPMAAAWAAHPGDSDQNHPGAQRQKAEQDLPEAVMNAGWQAERRVPASGNAGLLPVFAGADLADCNGCQGRAACRSRRRSSCGRRRRRPRRPDEDRISGMDDRSVGEMVERQQVGDRHAVCSRDIPDGLPLLHHVDDRSIWIRRHGGDLGNIRLGGSIACRRRGGLPF